jgi:hypothetical protein
MGLNEKTRKKAYLFTVLFLISGGLIPRRSAAVKEGNKR